MFLSLEVCGRYISSASKRWDFKQASVIISVLSPSAEVTNFPLPCGESIHAKQPMAFTVSWPSLSLNHNRLTIAKLKVFVLKVCQLFYFHPVKKKEVFFTLLPRIKKCVVTLQHWYHKQRTHHPPPPQPPPPPPQPPIFYDTHPFILNNLTKCGQNKKIWLEPKKAIGVSLYCMLLVFKQTAPLHSKELEP